MKVEISQWFLSKSIINYLDGLYKEVVHSVFLEVFRKRQYFSKEGFKAYSSETSKVSVPRKSEKVIKSQHTALKSMRRIFFVSCWSIIIFNVVYILTLLFES